MAKKKEIKEPIVQDIYEEVTKVEEEPQEYLAYITLVPKIIHKDFFVIIDKVIEQNPHIKFTIDYDDIDVPYKQHLFNRSKISYAIIDYNPQIKVFNNPTIKFIYCFYYR
jgi:hypothetical protein